MTGLGRGRVPLRRAVLASVASGAAGSLALDAVSYLDMLVRGRPASEVPSALAGRITNALGIGLGDRPRAGARAGALGGLLGHATGISVALGYGILGRRARRNRVLPAGLAVGAAAMAASDVPAAAARVTAPSRWGASGWLADVLPHAAYGLVTVAVYEALTGRRSPTSGACRYRRRRRGRMRRVGARRGSSAPRGAPMS